MVRYVFRVTGMSCQHCVMRVTKALEELEGVEKVDVDLASGNVTVSGTESKADPTSMENAITGAGYPAVAQNG